MTCRVCTVPVFVWLGQRQQGHYYIGMEISYRICVYHHSFLLSLLRMSSRYNIFVSAPCRGGTNALLMPAFFHEFSACSGRHADLIYRLGRVLEVFGCNTT